MRPTILIALILLLRSGAIAMMAQLPPEIAADAHLLRAEQAIRDGDSNRARVEIAKINLLQKEHELDLSDEFHFRAAKAAAAAGLPEQAREAVVKYLTAVGRSGPRYVEALELMNQLQDEIAGRTEPQAPVPSPLSAPPANQNPIEVQTEHRARVETPPSDLRKDKRSGTEQISKADAGPEEANRGVDSYYTLSGSKSVTNPIPLVQTTPSYTKAALDARVEGTLWLQGIVRKTGRVDSFKVISWPKPGEKKENYGLVESAIKEISENWRFKPGMIEGKPVDILATIEVQFNLRDYPDPKPRSSKRFSRPPFKNIENIDPDVIRSTDKSALVRVKAKGMERREVYDRRLADPDTNTRTEGLQVVGSTSVYLFDAQFSDGLSTEILVNTEVGNPTTAMDHARKYARIAGQMPTFLRNNLKTMTIHKADLKIGANQRTILIYTKHAEDIAERGFLEEVIYREGVHNSLDIQIRSDPKWQDAQEADGGFVSIYAQRNPTQEDIAESFVAWVIVRFRRARVHPTALDLIEKSIPNRLKYFDERYGTQRR